jgi:hypothetical protein
VLLIGTIAAWSEALNRLIARDAAFVLAVTSAVLCVLAFSGQIRVACGPRGLVAGIVWAMEFVRRRMIGEVVAFDQIDLPSHSTHDEQHCQY